MTLGTQDRDTGGMLGTWDSDTGGAGVTVGPRDGVTRRHGMWTGMAGAGVGAWSWAGRQAPPPGMGTGARQVPAQAELPENSAGKRAKVKPGGR